jgi:hypothetical protein
MEQSVSDCGYTMKQYVWLRVAWPKHGPYIDAGVFQCVAGCVYQ